MKRTIHFVSLLLILSCGRGQASIEDPFPALLVEQAPHQEENIQLSKRDFLPHQHVLRPVLRKIFTKWGMFRSRHHYEAAGFTIVRGHDDLMVGFHPAAKGYLFKKFTDAHSQKSQLRNFLKRIRGAQIVRDCIKRYGFKRLIVPHKWLYPLSKSLITWDRKHPYLLVVENMHICDANENAQRYREMDIETLTELCIVLHEVGGCDASLRNQCYTEDDRIAFVDTEHVGHKSGNFLTKIVPALHDELKPYAIALWYRLEQEKNEKEEIAAIQ